jgi:CheY-like chemotaxis protein
LDKRLVALVVDDDPVAREVQISLLEDGGLKVFDSYNGTNALKLLSEHPEVRLLITDVRMIGMSGDALARSARAIRPELQIVLTSGYFEFSPDPEFAFIPKPWRSAELNALLGGGQNA